MISSRGRSKHSSWAGPGIGAALLLFALLLAAWTGVGAAQEAAAGDSAASVADTTAAAASTGAGHDYIAEVRANFTPENKRYASTRVKLAFFDPFFGIIVSLIFLFTGLSAWMRAAAHRLFKGRYGRVLVYLAIYSVLGFLVNFPLSWYSGYQLEHQYGLSNQTFAAWFGEELKGALIGFIVFGLTGLCALAYAAIGRSPKRWWLWLGLGTIPVIVIITLIQPLVIEPVFNKFTPLRNVELKEKILALAKKADIPARKVLEADKSKQTKTYNAYVSGFGNSQRIVLWDTILKGMTEDEILFVVGHEMGHYKLGHIWKGILLGSLMSLVLFFLSGKMMAWAIARFGGRWGFQALDDIASLPLLGIALSLVLLVAQPLINSYSRGTEHEADMFGLELTHLNDAGARAFIKLGSQNKSDPEPSAFVRMYQYTHPPLVERIRFMMTYRPWEEGKPNKAYKPRG